MDARLVITVISIFSALFITVLVLSAIAFKKSTKTVAAFKGPTGEPGLMGAQGLNGATGATGGLGASGATGPSGVLGAYGPTGASGATGVFGQVGASGLIVGKTGVDGGQGLKGASGPAGALGAKGASGASGPTGLAGASVQGNIGASGPTGVFGPTGTSGAAGAAGTVTGEKGPDSVLNSFITQKVKHTYSTDPNYNFIFSSVFSKSTLEFWNNDYTKKDGDLYMGTDNKLYYQSQNVNYELTTDP